MATVLEQVEEKYEVVGKIKEGGMGAIYKVRHRLLGEERVVKIMRPQLEGDQEFAARFVREAQTLIRLRHPHIAQLYDFFADEAGNAAMVMEFISGIDLRELLRRYGPPSLGLAVEIAHQSLEAIGFLHRRKLVHRDISPDNLMLSRDADGKPFVKLIDLGIVKVLEAEATGLTSTGMFIGKVRYASPEQFKGGEGVKLDQRSDLYSFGAVFYELLTGRLPVVGDTASALIAAHLYHPPLGFDVTDPQGRVPSDLRALVFKLLAKEPEQRPENAEEVQQVLKALAQHYRYSADELAKLLPPPGETPTWPTPGLPITTPTRSRSQVTAPTAGLEPTAPTIPAPAPVPSQAVSPSTPATAPTVTTPPTPAPPPAAAPAAVTPPQTTTPAPTPPPAPQVAPPTKKTRPWLWVAGTLTVIALFAGVFFVSRQFFKRPQMNPASSPSGFLVVHAVPWARVVALKNGQGQAVPLPADAVTPLRLSLPAGSYSLELLDPETGKTVAATVQIMAGVTTRSVIPVREIPAEEFLRELGWR